MTSDVETIVCRNTKINSDSAELTGCPMQSKIKLGTIAQIIRIPLNENSPRVVGVAAAAFPSQRVISLLRGDFGTTWNSRFLFLHLNFSISSFTFTKKTRVLGATGRERPFGIQISNVECVGCKDVGSQNGDKRCLLKEPTMPNEES
ncbi:hypothetical protein Tco_0098012 [Tanacetum coccineum]